MFLELCVIWMVFATHGYHLPTAALLQIVALGFTHDYLIYKSILWYTHECMFLPTLLHYTEYNIQWKLWSWMFMPYCDEFEHFYLCFFKNTCLDEQLYMPNLFMNKSVHNDFK